MLSSPSSWSLPDVVQVGGEWRSGGKDSALYTQVHMHTLIFLYPHTKQPHPFSFCFHFRSGRYNYHANDKDTQEKKAKGMYPIFFLDSAGIRDNLEEEEEWQNWKSEPYSNYWPQSPLLGQSLSRWVQTHLLMNHCKYIPFHFWKMSWNKWLVWWYILKCCCGACINKSQTRGNVCTVLCFDDIYYVNYTDVSNTTGKLNEK